WRSVRWRIFLPLAERIFRDPKGANRQAGRCREPRRFPRRNHHRSGAEHRRGAACECGAGRRIVDRVQPRGGFGELGALLRAESRSPDAMGSGARAAPAVWRKPRMKVVGRVRVDDVPTIAAIERRSFSDPWSERSFRDVLSHPQIYFACIRDLVDGGGGAPAVLGYVVAWFASGQGEIA